MIIEERRSDVLNLETIDNDLRMERVRQSAEKLGWEHFSRSVRRNLLEKRQTLETRIRLDVLHSIAYMKEHLPIDNEMSIAQKVQQFSDSLGENCIMTSNSGGFIIKNSDVTIEIAVVEEKILACKIGYFGQPLFDAPDALALMKENCFTKFRDSVVGILSTLPKEISFSDKNSCKDALRALEQVLIRDASDSSFTAINTNKYGFYSPRTELRPGRLYFLAEPIIIRLAEKDGKSHADSSHLDHLPFIEFSFVKHDKPSKLPVFSQNGEWTDFNFANVCICLKFNHGFLFSQQTLRKLAHIVPKTPLVRHYVNFYRYMTGRSLLKQNFEIITQFPDESDVQQKYNVDAKKLSKEDDVVATEMYLSDLRDLPKVLEIIRSEWMHASLWESILAMCEPQQGENIEKEVEAVDMQVVLRRNEFHFQFDTNMGVVTIQISEKAPSRYVVKTTSQITGDAACSDLDKVLTDKLNRSWSIPAALTFAVADLNCRLISVQSPLNKCHANLSSFDSSDKPQLFWLPSSSKTLHNEGAVAEIRRRSRKTVVSLEIGPVVEPTQVIYTREDDEKYRGALLTSFGEVDPYYVETSTIGKTRAQPRPPKQENSQLASMDMMSADLNAEKGYAMNSMRQQEIQRMSLLESARVHMKQSIGAAHAVGLASHQPASSPGPMRHNSYPSGYDPSAPYDPAGMQFQDPTAFGKAKQRKSRAKKQPSEEGMLGPTGRGKGSRKGRGAAAVGAGGSRKSAAGGESPYPMDPMRPPLQRSFSDFLPAGHMNPQQYQQMQQMQQSQQYRMQMQQQQQMGMNSPKNPVVPAYVEEDSVVDEECDPPPPPKPQVSAVTPRPSVPPPQLGNPMVGYPGMPLQSPNHLPLTPSPLSAPPKPFSPEQQHFGMKMRENAYWRELERIETKPDPALLKEQMSSNLAASSSSAPSTSKAEPSTSSTDPVSTPRTSSELPKLPQTPTVTTPTSAPVASKKKLGLEAAISKIRGQQEQALQKQQQQQQLQQQESGESVKSEQPTPQPAVDQQAAPPTLAPHQLNRAKTLTGIFDDEADDSSPTSPDVKPSPSVLQKTLYDPSTPGPSSSTSSASMPPPVLTPNAKLEEEPEKEREKLILKIPKNIKLEDRKEDRKDKDRDRDRDRERDREGDKDRDREKDDKTQREKDKKERERERRRQRDRERAEQKRAERDKDVPSGKEKDSFASSSKKRKLDKKDEKDRREPDRKKGKSDGKEYSSKTSSNLIPTLKLTPEGRSLKNFRIPKKDTAEDDKKEQKEDLSVPGTSSAVVPESSRKEPAATQPIPRKESTSIPSAPSLQRKESFTSSSGSFPPSDHHRDGGSKKKASLPSAGPPPGVYPGPSNMGSISSGNRGSSGSGGSRKQPMPPPPQMMRGGPPQDQMYRERSGSMRAFPTSSHYHGGGGSSGNKQVASYAQGLPPGMGPPAAKPHGSGNYQASQWVRPPTHRDSHSYHGMPSLGTPQLQRELPQPPPQVIPLPREPPAAREPTGVREPSGAREPPRERAHRGGGGVDDDAGPDSPEEGTLRIDDE